MTDFEKQRTPEEIRRRFDQVHILLKSLVERTEHFKEAENLVREIVYFYGSPDTSAKNLIPRPYDYRYSYCKGKWAKEGNLTPSDIKVVLLLGAFFHDCTFKTAHKKAKEFFNQQPKGQNMSTANSSETEKLLRSEVCELRKELEKKEDWRMEAARVKRQLEDLRNQNRTLENAKSTIVKEEPKMIERSNGSKWWYLDNKLHREDGPAIEYPDCSYAWYLNGQLHREDGPALVDSDGNKYWYQNGRLHREDGPTIEYSDGSRKWFANGQELTKKQEEKAEEEFEEQKEKPLMIEDKFRTKRWYLNDKIHREDGPAVEYIDGSKFWYINGKCHREEGPASEWANGTKEWYLNGEELTEEEFEEQKKEKPSMVKYDNGDKLWYLNGQLHREDGPACEYADGSKCWYINGKLHREDGPAIEYNNGEKKWYIHDQLHRKDGPACEYVNGKKYWFLNGEELTEEKFEEQKKEKPSMVEDKYGTKRWYLNGQLHREDGPACKYPNGTKYWYLDGQFHREDGPACEYANGAKYWFLNGKLHRKDGPACKCPKGIKKWYINGKRLTEKEFEKLTKRQKVVKQIRQLLDARKILKDPEEIYHPCCQRNDENGALEAVDSHLIWFVFENIEILLGE